MEAAREGAGRRGKVLLVLTNARLAWTRIPITPFNSAWVMNGTKEPICDLALQALPEVSECSIGT